MLSIQDAHIKILLSRLLDGNFQLIDFIIHLKNSSLLEDSRSFHIENNFYNWLNYDVKKRELLHKNIHINDSVDIINHYNKYLEDLGLNTTYRRVKSLTECFNSRWWKHTEKKNTYWKIIHNVINNDIEVYCSDGENLFNSSLNFFNKDSIIKLSFVKSKNVINEYYIYFLIQSYTNHLKNISKIYTDPYLNIVYVE